jgi:cell wall-associated NlpC family hydrolase
MRPLVALAGSLLIVCAALALGLPTAASASPSLASARAQARALQGQVDSLDNQMEIVVERYDAASQKLVSVEASIARNEGQLARARYQLALAHQQLAAQLVAIYKTPAMQYLDVALSARTFSDLATRIAYYDKLGQQSALTVQEIAVLKAGIELRHRRLVAERSQAQRLVGEIAGQKHQIEAALAHRQQLLRNAKAQVRRIIAQIQAAKAAAAARAAAAAAAARAAAAAAGVAPVGLPSGGSSADITIAQRYLGVPYVWGGASPSGFDCSGLVMYVFAQLGVSLPHNAAMQFGCCTPVSRAALEPGDLVFYGYSPATIHHVGIYVGNNTMIDAPCTGCVVRYDTLFSDFYSGGRVN